VYCKTGKAKKSERKEDAPAPLYRPGIKIGCPHATKISCGIKGKPMPSKTETKKPSLKDNRCPFQFSFKWERDTNRWSLNGGTGCGHHEYNSFCSSRACKVVKLPDKIKQDIAKYADATANLAMIQDLGLQEQHRAQWRPSPIPADKAWKVIVSNHQQQMNIH
jgi:hypothetical protein